MQVTVGVGWESSQGDVPSLVLHYVHLHGALELRGEGEEAGGQVGVEAVLPLLVRLADSPGVQTEERAVTSHLR